MYFNFTITRGINAFLIVFVSLATISCAGTSKFTEEKLLVEMQKTPCYGACPVYTIKIDQNGNGIFSGEENTELIGKYSFRLGKEELSGLKEAFGNAGFFSLEDRYHQHVTDLPTTYLTYNTEERKKKIMDYYGAPQELKDLEKQVETLVLSKKMKPLR